MSAKVHLHLSVSSLARSREFYRQFFGSAPVKEKPGYVKFLPAWAPVNLALSEGPHAAKGVIHHVGVQVESPQTVANELGRVKSAGLPVVEEMNVNCCHANQDKFWVTDPDGVQWEVYHLNYDLEGDEADTTGRPTTLSVVGATASCCGSSACA